jgi:hypothetical protein
MLCAGALLPGAVAEAAVVGRAPGARASQAAPLGVAATLAATRVSLRLDAWSVDALGRLYARGTLVPGVKGRKVLLQVQVGTRWSTGAVVKSGARGALVAPLPTLREGSFGVRWFVPATATQAAALSKRLVYRVRPAPRPPTPARVGTVVPATLFGNHALDPSTPVGAATWRLAEGQWRAVQPLSATNWQWEALDKRMAQAKVAGVTVTETLGSTPTWTGAAAPDPLPATGPEYDGTGAAAPPTTSRYLAYVNALLARNKALYGNRITAFEVWNEGDLRTFWRGTPAALADLTKVTYAAIKKAMPSATVIAAGTGTRWISGGYDPFYPSYLRELAKRGWPVDAVSAHSYPWTAQGVDHRARLVGMVQESLRAAAAPARIALWDTEVNYGMAGAGVARIGFAGSAARTMLARTYLDSIRFGVARVYWFGWFGSAIVGIPMTAGSESAVAFVQTRSWVGGALYRGCAVASGVTTCTFTRGTAVGRVVWSGAATTIARPLGVRIVRHLDATSAAAPARIAVGPEPVFLG